MLENLDLKKTYYYIICLITFFVFMWGAIDLASAAIAFYNVKSSTEAYQKSAGEKNEDTFVDMYYQKKMLSDRILDSLSRVVIAGLIFGYGRIKINKMGG